MVAAIRNVEIAFGDGVKRVAAGEVDNIPFARKSLVAAKNIRAGEKFCETNVVAMRPGTGISPMRWDDVIGRVAPRNFSANELIEI